MRKYWHIAKMQWQAMLAYPTDTFLEAIGNLLTMLIAISLWKFAFLYGDKDVIGNYTKFEMVGYLFIAGMITSALWVTAQGDKLAADIGRGRISKFLVKPHSLTLHYITKALAGKLFRIMLTLFAVVLLFVVMDVPIPVLHWPRIFIFLFLMIIAILIQTLILHNVAILAFWMDEVWGILFVMRVLMDIAAGTFLPLALFAPFWQHIFAVLPFQYIVSAPVNILLGKSASYEILPIITMSILWLGILLIVNRILWQRGIRHYIAVGD